MINLTCPGCGSQVEVESLLTAHHRRCDSCGELVMSGGPPQKVSRYKPWEDPELESKALGKKTYGVSALIDLLAVLTLGYGALHAVCGFCTWALMSAVVSMLDEDDTWKEQVEAENGEAAVEMIELFLTVGVALCFLLFLLGVGRTICGWGLKRRFQWARIGTLVIGFLDLMSAGILLYLMVMMTDEKASPTILDVIQILLGLAYGVFAIALLTNEKAAAQFRA